MSQFMSGKITGLTPAENLCDILYCNPHGNCKNYNTDDKLENIKDIFLAAFKGKTVNKRTVRISSIILKMIKLIEKVFLNY